MDLITGHFIRILTGHADEVYVWLGVDGSKSLQGQKKYHQYLDAFTGSLISNITVRSVLSIKWNLMELLMSAIQ